MRWISRFANPLYTGFCRSALPTMLLALSMAGGSAFAAAPAEAESHTAPSAEMAFTKGDTRDGSKIHLRVVGDSLYFRETIYAPDAAPKESRKTLYLYGRRRRALLGVLGDLPRYPGFGTCYGKDMRFYMVETPAGNFYRSLPEQAGKCYVDEPGIWSLFRDLDDLLSPPAELEYQEYSAS
jgi:hypothetical protein